MLAAELTAWQAWSLRAIGAMADPLSRLAFRVRCTAALPGALVGEFDPAISSIRSAGALCASAFFGLFGAGSDGGEDLGRQIGDVVGNPSC